jgi:LPS-assembly protein
MPRNTLPRLLLCAAVLATIARPAIADKEKAFSARITERPQSCRATLAEPVPESALSPDDTDDGRLHILADQAEVRFGETATFRGNTELRYGGLHLFADEVTHNQDTNSLRAHGNIRLSKDSGETILAPRLRYELDTERGEAEEARFSFAEGLARGDARHLRFEGRDALLFEDVRYTTCPPDRDDWILRASTLTLDKATEIGTARNVTIRFMQVPVFYTPYLSFPLTEERKTGFLNPRIGQSSRNGFMLSVPYYLNLAPNYDDTLTPRWLGKRGLQLQNELRYLGEQGDGMLTLEYLPDDHSANRDRGAAYYQHKQRFSPLWSAEADLQGVSDNSYLIDLADVAGQAGVTHLPRSLRFDYGGKLWRFSARAATYQTLDDTIPLGDQPYQRLPQLLLAANPPAAPNRLHPSLDAEWVNFYRQSSATVNSPTGQRLDLFPNVSLPLRTSYLYFTPKAGYRYTTWQLDNTCSTTLPVTCTDTTPERALPIYSVDSGVTFEREDNWLGRAYTQTLEPRLYYLRIPYEDQDSLPVFDTVIPDFSFYNFFRENRFVGGDRLGDANQLTATITTRFLLPENGIEQGRLSVGQIAYFEDQRVNLPAGPPVSQTRSDLIGEAYARIGQPWYLRGGVQWDTRERESRKGSFYLHYRPANDRILNFGYRYINSLQDLVDVSGQWPLASRWTGVARWNYSLPESRTVQAYAGIEYTSCCWAFRTTVRQRVLPDGREDKGVLFELELTGLAKLGETVESPFKQSQFIFEDAPVKPDAFR